MCFIGHDGRWYKYIGTFSTNGNAPYVVRECQFDKNRQQGRFLPKDWKWDSVGEYFVPGESELQVRHRVFLADADCYVSSREFWHVKDAYRMCPGTRIR
jgi:hypothetical protein